MGICDVCGNDYEKSFTLTDASGDTHTFDSFECAIHAVAPRCAHCQCRVIGHGVHGEDEAVYCCAACERQNK